MKESKAKCNELKVQLREAQEKEAKLKGLESQMQDLQKELKAAE